MISTIIVHILKILMNNYTEYMQYFENYKWLLREIGSKEAEIRKISGQINSGIISRDSLDSEWKKSLTTEIDNLRSQLQAIEELIDSIPSTNSMLPCKIFLRLHYVLGFSMTETANEMNVSLSTLRRIKRRSFEYYAQFPPA